MIARALLLIGSAKPSGSSTSEALGRYLVERLEARGVVTEVVPVTRARTADDRAWLAETAADSDLFILSSPLYVDSLPYLVTAALESLAEARGHRAPARRCAFAAIINCGFPEARQCQTALDITRVFARRARFDWAGGLALGEGGAIDGRRLQDAGALVRHVRAALDLTASALLEGSPVPAAAVKQMARPLLPVSLYTFMGDLGWKRQARRNGVRRQLGARPFERERQGQEG